VKDITNGNGMTSTKTGIMDPHHGHFSDSRFSNMTKEAIEEVGRQIIAKQYKDKMTPEDIAAAKAVKEVLGIYDGGYSSNRGGGEAPKTAEGGAAKPAEGGAAKPAGGAASNGLPDELNPAKAPKAAPAKDELPPELDPNAAKLTQEKDV
jgi:hypothetical protein